MSVNLGKALGAKKHTELCMTVQTEPSVLSETIASQFIKTISYHDVYALASAALVAGIDEIRRKNNRDTESVVTSEIASMPILSRSASRTKGFEHYRDALLCPTRRKDREDFRDWLGDKAFQEWYATMHARAQTKGVDEVEYLEASWDPNGPMAYMSSRHMNQLSGLVRNFAANVRLELTREFLETRFALGDGTQVSWGEATAACFHVADHGPGHN